MVGFGLFKEPKNVNELFTFDLTTFFYEEDYEEIQSAEQGGVFMVEYEKNLPWTELDLFDKVVFRVFNEKGNINGSNHINVKFPADPEKINKKSAKHLINALYKINGWDDENHGEWNDQDELNFNNQALSRQWTLGEGKLIYSVRLNYTKQDELLLEILFFNHLIELINS